MDAERRQILGEGGRGARVLALQLAHQTTQSSLSVSRRAGLVEPPSRRRGPVGAQVTVTAADAGKPINLRTGDALLLRLTETAPVPGSSLRYSVDADPAVLQVTGDFRYPNQATAKTSVHSFRFTAARSGTTFVVATGHQACEAMDPRYCRQPAPLSFPVTVRS